MLRLMECERNMSGTLKVIDHCTVQQLVCFDCAKVDDEMHLARLCGVFFLF